MKKVLKYLVLATALTVGLTFMPQAANDVFAARNESTDGTDANSKGGTDGNSSNSNSGGGGGLIWHFQI